MLLVDSDVLIDVQLGRAQAVRWISSLPVKPAIPGPVAMELVQGAKNTAQLNAALRLVAPFTIVWPSEGDFEAAFRTFSKFHLSHGLGLLDAIIAETALRRGATLVTGNLKHFSVVPGLQVKLPYAKVLRGSGSAS